MEGAALGTSPAANGTETYAWAEGTTAAALRDAVNSVSCFFDTMQYPFRP